MSARCYGMRGRLSTKGALALIWSSIDRTLAPGRLEACLRMDRRPAKRRWRSARNLGVAVSLLIHLAAVIAIATSPSPATDLPVGHPIEMELFAPVHAQRPLKVAPTKKSQNVAASTASTLKTNTPPVAATVSPPSPPILETQALSSPAASPTSFGTALRGSVGCEHAGLFTLSDDERRGCRERLATGRATAAQWAELGIDPKRRAVFDAAWKADHDPQHMAGFACLAKFGGGKIQWAHPSEGVKAPHLPCYFYTPKATFAVDPPHKSAW